MKRFYHEAIYSPNGRHEGPICDLETQGGGVMIQENSWQSFGKVKIEFVEPALGEKESINSRSNWSVTKIGLYIRSVS